MEFEQFSASAQNQSIFNETFFHQRPTAHEIVDKQPKNCTFVVVFLLLSIVLSLASGISMIVIPSTDNLFAIKVLLNKAFIVALSCELTMVGLLMHMFRGKLRVTSKALRVMCSLLSIFVSTSSKA